MMSIAISCAERTFYAEREEFSQQFLYWRWQPKKAESRDYQKDTKKLLNYTWDDNINILGFPWPIFVGYLANERRHFIDYYSAGILLIETKEGSEKWKWK